MRLDAEAGEFRAMECGGVIVAHFANVARAESPLLASDDCGGGLTAGKDRGGPNFDFRAARGIVRDRNQCVGGVEPHADEIDFFHLRGCCHFAGVNVTGRGKVSQLVIEEEQIPKHSRSQ